MEIKHEFDSQMAESFKKWLIEQEKSKNTISKYMHDINDFMLFFSSSEKSIVDKLCVMEYKEQLQGTHAASSVNSMLVAVNKFLQYLGWNECCVKLLKVQRRIFREESKELTKEEYVRLVNTARNQKNERLSMVMETICSTGIRVSELQYITAEAVRSGRAEINCKGKRRTIFIPDKLCRQLRKYANKYGIRSGCIFRTKSGKPLDRSNIWHDMKALCREAGVEESKVFPHSLRHLFARTFYGVEKDIVRLADILGHSSIETTRIYTISSGIEHAEKVNRLGLVI